VADEEKECPQGWDQEQLFAYVEREMDNSARKKLEAHLKSCEICASEVESLQKMDVLLKHHADIFHLDEQQLYRYVTAGDDPEGEIARHLESCENCQEDVQLLKEMISARSAAPTKIPAMQQRLLRRIEQLRPAAAPEGIFERLLLAAAALISAPFRMPKLALGTAAAVVVLAIISIPLWQALKSVPRPDLGVTLQEAPSQKPSEALPSGTDQYRQDLEKDKLMERHERFSDGSHGETRAPLSPAPTMRYAPERRLEKPDHLSVGRVSPRPESAPTQAPPSPTMKEKAHPPTAGGVPQTEKESLARPRASKPAAPASPMKKQAAKSRYPATAEEAKPEGAAPSASVSESLIPVRIRIVDSEGKSIPGFKFRLPANLASRYSLREETESGPADLVVVRVVKRNGSFDLSADLFESNSTSASRIVQAFSVPERDWLDRIPSLISSLLEKK